MNRYAIILPIYLLSCQSPEERAAAASKRSLDSLQRAIYIDSAVDAMMKKTKMDAAFDTIGLWNAPVKILTAKMIEKEYSSYRSIRIEFKNVSNKKIDAIRFKWYGLNSFGEPADMGSYTLEGLGGGFTETTLKPGASSESTWNILSKDGRKIVLAWPYEVAFADGTKWKTN